MPHYLVELAELRAACRRLSRALGLEPSRGAQGDQPDEDPEAPTEHPEPQETP